MPVEPVPAENDHRVDFCKSLQSEDIRPSPVPPRAPSQKGKAIDRTGGACVGPAAEIDKGLRVSASPLVTLHCP